MATYIHDGLTLKAYVAPSPRLHGEVRLEYRPSTVTELNRFLDGLKNRSLAALAKAEAAAVAKKLVAWDVTDHDGNPVDPCEVAVLSLHPNLFRRLKEIVVYGTDGGDADPEEDHDAEAMDDIADAAERGLRILDVSEEKSAKN